MLVKQRVFYVIIAALCTTSGDCTNGFICLSGDCYNQTFVEQSGSTLDVLLNLLFFKRDFLVTFQRWRQTINWRRISAFKRVGIKILAGREHNPAMNVGVVHLPTLFPKWHWTMDAISLVEGTALLFVEELFVILSIKFLKSVLAMQQMILDLLNVIIKVGVV